MARPKIDRVICTLPKHKTFAPADGGTHCVITLSADEYEMIRLHDLEHLHQTDAAKQMRISRPTAANLLASAHEKIADALVNGKTIQIELGNCRVCEVGCLCPLEKGDSCENKHRCGAACKDKFKNCQQKNL